MGAWHFFARTLADLPARRRHTASGKFYRESGKHCGYFDFLPVCLGDKLKVKETLVRIT